MARINIKFQSLYTHGGGKACRVNPEQELIRSVMSCMLWEKEFYESGESIAERIIKLIPNVKPIKVKQIAINARNRSKLRHVPLLIVREMARLSDYKRHVSDILQEIIQRPDELTEFLAIYWKDGKCPISKQVKKGLALAFNKFSEYQLAKYNRKTTVKLIDVLKMVHPHPGDQHQSELWVRLLNNTLVIPDTWEVALSTIPKEVKNKEKYKRQQWERLLSENKLGGMALLRNLRNMQQVGVSCKIISDALEIMRTDKILPFRFISAAQHNPQIEPAIEKAMLKNLNMQSKLSGKTILIVDVSGSMYGTKISLRSELNRAQVACSLAILVRELCEEPVIYATAGDDYTRIHNTSIVPLRRGFGLSDVIYKMCNPLGGGGIFLTQVMKYVKNEQKTANRIILITDEQDCDNINSPARADAFGDKNYIINIASSKNGIGYGKWTHISGWSESVINYIMAYEKGYNYYLFFGVLWLFV